MQKNWLVETTNWKQAKQTSYEVVVIPWGAHEAHNYHLPFGTDNYLTSYVADKAAEKAWKEGCRAGVLPVIPFGVNTGQLDLALTINMNPSTQLAVLNDIIHSLYGTGHRKFVIFNGHGGNDFRQMIRELQTRYPDSFICQLNWYQAVPLENYFEDTGEHAGEAETSAMLVVAPELLRPLEEAGDGKHKKLRFDGRKEGWLWAPRPWSIVSKDTGIGNPAKATAEKGSRYLADSILKIAGFLVELCKTPLNQLYTE